jgi:hypothetical protein
LTIGFVHALVLVWAAGLAVRVFPFQELARVLLRGRRSSRPCDPDRIAAVVGRASARCWPAPGCLARALVTCRLLAERGVDAEVVLGVQAGGGRLAAHAWVESGGRIVDPDPCGAERFAELHRIHPRAVESSWP